MSRFWFDMTGDIIQNHFVADDLGSIMDALDKAGVEDPAQYGRMLDGRSMLCRKGVQRRSSDSSRLLGWFSLEGVQRTSEADPYAVSINLHGMILPPDMMEWQELPRPFFTPSTKADIGQHDENISAEEARELAGYIDGVGIEYFSLRLYQWAREYAQARGIIITDTKFELFRLPDGSLMLGDEVLTPDSSRFNPLDLYEPGESQPSFDKQFVRDYLQYLCDMGEWDKTYPAPELPAEIVEKTAEKYREAYRRITGCELTEGSPS